MKNTKKPTVQRKKGELPTKICATCGRPFEWRKRWERHWDEVRYCSERCRNTRTTVREHDDPKS
ncbi:MAG: hypothetical protein NVS4B12_16990 [Ktedonobacteraceae bacterium]